MFAKIYAFTPGAMAAVKTPVLSVSPGTDNAAPSVHVMAGCSNNAVMQIIKMILASPSGLYWIRTPPKANKAVGNAACVPNRARRPTL